MKYIFGLVFLSWTTLTYAAEETYLESNHENVPCEWKSEHDKGKGICHIIAQGTQHGETTTSFRIGNRPEVFTISDQEQPTITLEEGKNWNIIWKGKLLEDNWQETQGYHAIETIKLSNGYTIILYR